MANLGKTPGSEAGESIESRRTAQEKADPSDPAGLGDAEEPAPDLPSMGELAPEAARPTPLDDIAEAEREQAPRD